MLKVFTGSDIDEDELAEAVQPASGDASVVILIDDGEQSEDCDAEDELEHPSCGDVSVGRLCPEGAHGEYVDPFVDRVGAVSQVQEDSAGEGVAELVAQHSQPAQVLLRDSR